MGQNRRSRPRALAAAFVLPGRNRADSKRVAPSYHKHGKRQAPHCRHVEKYRRSKCLTERRKTSLRLSPEAVHVPTCRRPSQCAPPRKRPAMRPLERAEILVHRKCSPETTETILRARRSPARWWHGNSGRACIQSAIRFPPRTLVKDSRQQRRASFPGQFWFVHDKISDRQGNASCRETTATRAIPSNRTMYRRLYPGHRLESAASGHPGFSAL